MKEKAQGKSWAHLCSRTSLSFALKPAGLLGWLVEGADVLMSLRFNQAACLVPALTGLQTKCFLSLRCGEHCLANVICQVNQGEWALRWLLDSLATLPWKQAAKQLLALFCSAEIWHEKPMFYLPSTKQLAEDASSFFKVDVKGLERVSLTFYRADNSPGTKAAPVPECTAPHPVSHRCLALAGAVREELQPSSLALGLLSRCHRSFSAGWFHRCFFALHEPLPS